jgi:aspartate/glutamate racemase
MKVNRIAGVIGGMGPDATVDFMAKVIAFTSAEVRDNEASRRPKISRAWPAPTGAN